MNISEMKIINSQKVDRKVFGLASNPCISLCVKAQKNIKSDYDYLWPRVRYQGFSFSSPINGLSFFSYQCIFTLYLFD